MTSNNAVKYKYKRCVYTEYCTMSWTNE